jgi:hypothetical protein
VRAEVAVLLRHASTWVISKPKKLLEAAGRREDWPAEGVRGRVYEP